MIRTGRLRLRFCLGFRILRNAVNLDSGDRIRMGAYRTEPQQEWRQSLFVIRVRRISVVPCPFGFWFFIVTLSSVRSFAYFLFVVSVRSVCFIVVFLCDRYEFPTVTTVVRVTVSVSSVCYSSTVVPSGLVLSVVLVRVRQYWIRNRRSRFLRLCRQRFVVPAGLFVPG